MGGASIDGKGGIVILQVSPHGLHLLIVGNDTRDVTAVLLVGLVDGVLSYRGAVVRRLLIGDQAGSASSHQSGTRSC